MTRVQPKHPSLNAAEIERMLAELEVRVLDRFPNRGLAQRCGDLRAIAAATAQRVEAGRRPARILHFAALLVVVIAALLAWPLLEFAGAAVFDIARFGPAAALDASPSDMMQAFESAVNLVILAALALWFLVSLEARWKRRSALKHLHELRSLSHIVDMHQLAKDPISILNPALLRETSPKRERDFSPQELSRYLGYCIEMLSLIGKLAALYAEHTDDQQIISSANDVEVLTTSISGKIWQKVTLIAPAASARPASFVA